MDCQTCKDWEEVNEFCGVCGNSCSAFFTIHTAHEHTCKRHNQEYLCV